MHWKNRQEAIKKAKRVIRANSNWRHSFSLLIKTRKPCSCMGCGHRRFWYGCTRQELAIELEQHEQTETLEKGKEI